MNSRLLTKVALSFMLIACLTFLFRSGTSQGAFVTTTINSANSVTTLTVAPPTAASADMSLNILPLGTCKSNIHWTASVTSGITGYEVVRVRISDGGVDAGPWTTMSTSYLDNPVPLQLPGNSYEWHIRTMLSTWRSQWVTAAANNSLACTL